jgi:hypothetical protein
VSTKPHVLDELREQERWGLAMYEQQWPTQPPQGPCEVELVEPIRPLIGKVGRT